MVLSFSLETKMVMAKACDAESIKTAASDAVMEVAT